MDKSNEKAHRYSWWIWCNINASDDALSTSSIVPRIKSTSNTVEFEHLHVSWYVTFKTMVVYVTFTIHPYYSGPYCTVVKIKKDFLLDSVHMSYFFYDISQNSICLYIGTSLLMFIECTKSFPTCSDNTVNLSLNFSRNSRKFVKITTFFPLKRFFDC